MNTKDHIFCTEPDTVYSPKDNEYSTIRGEPVFPNIGEGLAFIIERLKSSIDIIMKKEIYQQQFVVDQELHSVTSVDIFDPMPELATRMTVIRADLHQSDKKFDRKDFAKVSQCTAIAMVACALDETTPPDEWTTEILNKIINVGDSVYRRVRARAANRSGKNPEPEPDTNVNLGVDEIDDYFWFNGVDYHVQPNIEDEVRLIDPAIKPLTLKSLKKELAYYFAHFKKGVLTAMDQSIAIIRSSDKNKPLYCMFDSHGRSPRGLPYGGYYKKAGALMIFQNYQDMAEAIIRIFCSIATWRTPEQFMDELCGRNFVILPVTINIIQNEEGLKLEAELRSEQQSRTTDAVYTPVSQNSPPSPPPKLPKRPSDSGFEPWALPQSGRTHPLPPPPHPRPEKSRQLYDREAKQYVQQSGSPYPAHTPVYHNSSPPPLPRKPAHSAAPTPYSFAPLDIKPMFRNRQPSELSISIPRQNFATTQVSEHLTMPEPIVYGAPRSPHRIESKVYRDPRSRTEPDIYPPVQYPMPVPEPYSPSESSMPGINRARESPTTSEPRIHAPVPKRPDAINTFLGNDWSTSPETEPRELPTPPSNLHTSSSPTSPASTSARSLPAPPSQASLASPTSPTTRRNSPTPTDSAAPRRLGPPRSPIGGRPKPPAIISTPPPVDTQ